MIRVYMMSYMLHRIGKTSLRRQMLLTLIIFLSLCQFEMSSAQERIPREIHLGVVGGANISQYTFHPTVSQRYTGSYTMGVAARYIEEQYFGLQMELLLTERGFADLWEPNTEDWVFERKLLYVELPVMAHVYFNMGKRNQVAVDLGPKLAWFLSDRTNSNLPDNYGQTGLSVGNQYMHHELPIEKKFDYGLQFGLGYEFRINELLSAQLTGRYYFGLGNLWPDSKADHFEQASNSSFQISLGVWWHHVIKGKKTKK